MVVDLAKVLLGSHNWTEGSLSGKKVYDSSVLLVLPGQDIRWADYIFSRETVSDMRTPELWREELRNIRSARGRGQKSQIPAYEQDEEGL